MIQTSLSKKRLLLKSILLFFVPLFISINALAQPVISSFSPSSGPIGTTVTITGTGFNTTAANNIVFFGVVKASVTAASATSLTVTVPAGATYQPITVTVNNLTGSTAHPFVVTFPGNPAISPGVFGQRIKVDSVEGASTDDLAISDFDNDGKIDLAVVDNINQKLSVYRNTTESGVISFAAGIDYVTGKGAKNINYGDFDGDGKQDLVVSFYDDSTVSVYRNTSTQGNISFSSGINFSTASRPGAIAIGDLDADGKPDIATVNINFSAGITVLRNTSSAGTISFEAKKNYQLEGSSTDVSITDMDGDGKPDLIASSYFSSKLFILRNTSTTGVISFQTALVFTAGNYRYYDKLAVGDLDGDGKHDIAVTDYTNKVVSIFRNTSSVGNISLAIGNDLSVESSPNDVAMSDVDGDGKADLISLNVFKSFSVFKNNSTAGNIVFAPKRDKQVLCQGNFLMGDFDADGKSDIAALWGVYKAVILKNKVTFPYVSSFTPDTAPAGTTVTINGYNFTGTSAVSFGAVPATSFTIQSPVSITAVVGSGGTGAVKVTNDFGSDSLSTFLFQGPPVISSFTPDSATTYNKVVITGQNFNGTTDVKFGGTFAPFDLISPYTIEAYVGKGSSGDVTVTNPYGTASKPGFIYIPKPFITSFSPTQAVSGSTITITGINLSTVTSVRFGGTNAASFTVIDSATIRAVVAAGSSGDVSITNPNGTALKPGFTYYPPPVITSFTPTEAAQGDTITISGFNFKHYYNNAYITGVKFGNANAFSFSVIDSFTIKATVNFGATGAVTVESDRGNSSLNGFTFIDPPAITSVSPTVVGTGSVVTITGTNLSRATAVTFGDVPASLITVVSPDTIKAVVANGATGSVVVTTPKHSTRGGSVSYVTANPVIHQVFPLSGPAGTIVTISGANFQPQPANNIVYFGGVKATVITASPNTLTVAVPVGTTYQPITVTSLSNRLTAQSNKRFTVTFPVDNNAFNDSSFAGNMDFITGQEPYDFKEADLDADGKLDIVVVNHGSTFLSVFRNISTVGTVAFSARMDQEIGINAKALAIADMDGDGKKDLIVSSDGSNPRIYIYRNQSTPGNMAFVNAYEVSGFYFNAGFIETADFDVDGRPDIVFVCTNCGVANGGIYVVQNLSNNGVLSFSSARLHSSGVSTGNAIGTTAGLAITDFQNDGKPDVAVGLWGSSALFFFQNNSNPETFIHFSVSTKGDLSVSDGYYSLTPFTGNFHSNEFADLVSNKFVYKNSNGVYSKMLETFAIATGVYDLNGDGMHDILGNHLINGKLSLIKNTSRPDAVRFAQAYTTTVNGGLLRVGDLDGDSKPEICILYPTFNMLRILRNRSGESMLSSPYILSFSPASATAGSVVTIKGTNFTHAINVSFGDVDASSFTVVDSATITAVVANGASGNVTVITNVGFASLPGFTYNVVTAVNNMNTNSKELTVNPNPANDRIIIKHPASARYAQLAIIDQSGRTVKTLAAEKNQNQTAVSVKELAAGIYQLVWRDGTRQLHKSFIIIR